MEQVALRISNIKLCHIVFQITLFTSLSFQKKKKCKRYSNSTQFKFFFSSLNFPKEEFQKQERVWSKAAIPRGSRGAHSPSVWRFSAQSHSGKDIQVWKIRGTLFFGGQVN